MRWRTMLGIVAALCVCAIAAQPAMGAKAFKTSAVNKEYTEAEPGKTKGVGVEFEGRTNQLFLFGPFRIRCEKALESGKVAFKQSKTILISVKYVNCVGVYLTTGSPPEEITLPAVFKKPVDFEYHANGFAETGSESESELKLVNPRDVELRNPQLKCTIVWPTQTVPVRAKSKPEAEYSVVGYQNVEVERVGAGGKKLKQFPTGFQRQLVIDNDLKKMRYELKRGQCEHFKVTEGKDASYQGAIQVQVLGGNLWIGEEEEVV